METAMETIMEMLNSMMDEVTNQVYSKKRKIDEDNNFYTDNTAEYNFNPEHVDSIEDSSEHSWRIHDHLRTPLFRKVKKIIQDKRKWWYTDYGKRHFLHPTYGLDFTVLSYNILSQKLLENHGYLYARCEPEYLTWNYRSRNLLREINKYNAHIMCLQEVEENHYNQIFLPHFMERGYYGIYKKKTGNAREGCAIFFKNNVFRLVEKLEVEFDKSSIVGVLNRNNIALIAVLQPNEPSLQYTKLVCVSTHLLFNPRRGDVKIAQLRLLLATIEKLARIDTPNTEVKEYHPIIFCGDLNSEPFYPLYDFIIHRFIKYVNVLSGNISGQCEGLERGRYMTEDALSLSALGINQNTIYETLEFDDDADTIRSLLQEILQKINENLASGYDSTGDLNSNTNNQSKYLFHPLNFTSTYKHLTENGELEMTTKLSRQSSTVDYIFYNVNREISSWQEDGSDNEGVLKHLGCYGLFPNSDIEHSFDLPNAYLSSDHFSLLSRFLLTRK